MGSGERQFKRRSGETERSLPSVINTRIWGQMKLSGGSSNRKHLTQRTVKLVMEFAGRYGGGHLMRREDSLEKTLMLGKMEGTRRRGRLRMRWLDSVLEVTSMSLAKLREAVKDRRAWRALVHGVTKSRTRLND